MRRRAIGAAIALAVVVLLALVASAMRTEEPTVPLHEVKLTDFQRRVTAEGTLQAVNATPISPPVAAPGPLKIAWLAPDGGAVKQGEIVVQFDPTDFETQLQSGSRSEAKTSNRLTSTELQSGAVRHNLTLDAEQAQREYDATKRFTPRDVDIFSRHELIESEIDGDLALERREFAEGVLGVRQNLSASERQLLAIEMRSAKMQVSKAQQGLQALEVRAPHDGILVLSRDWRGELPRVGGTVFPGRSIGQIPDLSKMEAEVYVLEADAGGLEPGQPAQVVVESKPEVVWKGTVKKIDKVARQRFRGVPVQYFGVTVELETTDPTVMKPGARVRATIQVDDRSEVVTVPRQAIFDREGEKVVYRMNGRSFEPVVVELDGGSAGVAIVKSGLEPGDRLALRDPGVNGNGSEAGKREAAD